MTYGNAEVVNRTDSRRQQADGGFADGRLLFLDERCWAGWDRSLAHDAVPVALRARLARSAVGTDGTRTARVVRIRFLHEA